MVNISPNSAFQQAIEAAERLSVEERLELLDVLQQRMKQAARQSLRTDVSAVRAEYQSGNVHFGTVDDFLSVLDES